MAQAHDEHFSGGGSTVQPTPALLSVAVACRRSWNLEGTPGFSPTLTSIRANPSSVSSGPGAILPAGMQIPSRDGAQE